MKSKSYDPLHVMTYAFHCYVCLSLSLSLSLSQLPCSPTHPVPVLPPYVSVCMSNQYSDVEAVLKEIVDE
jgi:hypothetical protein